jgi:predicted AlkP superfamily phosphohydrolase/phosphomutase
MTTSTKVLLLEFNEISWSVIDRLLAERGEGFLPNICRLRNQGSWGTSVALEQPPLLDPWVTWVTVHTGVSQAVHGAKVLEQDAATVGAKRSWEYAAEAGHSIGVFGSIGAYPPPQVNGFVVPGPFAPGDDTFPRELKPIQSLNRRHTHAHGGSRRNDSVFEMLKAGSQLLRLGLRPATCARIASQLARERANRRAAWRRVMLQPLVNYDFFAELYRRQRPTFATWHTNHAAHYMHHYWRAWSDSGFLSKGPEDERAVYGEAVPLGYKLCDELLGRFLGLIDKDTVLVLCSSMGQQPFVNAAYREGKAIVRFKNIQRFLQQIDAEGVTETVPTMVPQVNLRVPDPILRTKLAARIREIVRTVDGKAQKGIVAEETGEILTVTPLSLSERASNVTYKIPGVENLCRLEDLFAMDAPTVKQGMHHPNGLFIAYGKGVPEGLQLGTCTNLDIAPTLLSLLGVPIPKVMNGRVLLRAS